MVSRERQPGQQGSSGSEQSAWVKVFGDNSFIDYAFEYARKYATAEQKLILSQDALDEDKTLKPSLALINLLKEKGLIDGVGIQAHYSPNSPNVFNMEDMMKEVTESCEQAAEVVEEVTTEAVAEVVEEVTETMQDYEKELEAYRQGVQALTREIPGAEDYLAAAQQELASDLRYALWLGFQWNLECFRNPVNKLLLNEDFQELCQESRMCALPYAQTSRQKRQSFAQSIPEEKRELLDPITDHFAYLKTWGYKLAFCEGFCLADRLLPHLLPGYTPDAMLSMRLAQKLQNNLGVTIAA